MYLLDCHKNLVIVDEILGDVRGRLPLTGVDLFAGTTRDAGVYGATREGFLFCIRPVSAGHLTPAMMR